MNIIKSKLLNDKQSSQINTLWNDEYPLALKDRFPILLDGVENYYHYLIEDADENVIAWAVYFEKDNEIRFSVIVADAHKGKGLGTVLVNQLKEEQNEFYGWVIDHNEDLKSNGEYYTSPLSFYRKQGFEVLNDVRIDTEMLRAVKVKWINK